MSVLQSLLELGKETGMDLLTIRPARDRLSACLAWPESSGRGGSPILRRRRRVGDG